MRSRQRPVPSGTAKSHRATLQEPGSRLQPGEDGGAAYEGHLDLLARRECRQPTLLAELHLADASYRRAGWRWIRSDQRSCCRADQLSEDQSVSSALRIRGD